MSNFKKTHIPKFRRFVIQSFPFIEEDFDALTDYGLICKVVEFLNSVIESTNESSAQVEELTNLYNQLKSYVDNYFDNLDVQDEINNKLDALVTDGTIYRLINDEIFGDINNRVLAQSQQINQLEEDQLLNVKKNEAGSITLEMLSQAVREAMTGGSTPVVGVDSVDTENIVDSAVTFLKLEDNIRDNFDINITPVNKGAGQPGFYYVVTNLVGGTVSYSLPAQSNINYCYVCNLQKGRTYRFTGFNYSASRGLIIGTDIGEPSLLLSPSMGALNKGIYGALQDDVFGTDILFTVNEDNLKAYITTFTDAAFTQGNKPSLLKDIGTLYEVSSITPYDRTVSRDVWKPSTAMYTYDNSYIQQTVNEGETNNRNPFRIQSINNANYHVRIYKLHKNHKYRATGRQQWANAGFMLLDNYCEISYVSQEYSQSAANDFEYEFTAANDGFAVLQDTSATLKSYLYEAEESSLSSSRLSGLTIAYNGDSITESRTNQSLTTYNGGAYPKIIADLTNSSYANFSVGGGTLAEISTSGHQVVNDIVNMNGNYDAIILSGGINDYWKNVPLGSYTEGDYTSDVNITTICGALESIFRQAINKWCGKPIMFVITHKIGGTAFTPNTAGYTFDDVHEKIVGICHKYSIPYYDAYQDSGLNSYLEIMNTTYMTAGASGRPDHTHPNEEAYKRYYVPQVISMIEENLKY